jgi:hypothetical protein
VTGTVVFAFSQPKSAFLKIYWPQMSAVQNLVELLDLPQDLLSHQVMEQFTAIG